MDVSKQTLITFNNGEVKRFDVNPYLGIEIFRELKDLSVFNSVKPFLGSIQWANGLDLCPETLYMEVTWLKVLIGFQDLSGLRNRSIISEILPVSPLPFQSRPSG